METSVTTVNHLLTNFNFTDLLYVTVNEVLVKLCHFISISYTDTLLVITICTKISHLKPEEWMETKLTMLLEFMNGIYNLHGLSLCEFFSS